MNTFIKTVGIVLMASFVTSFTAIGSGFAQERSVDEIMALAQVSPVKPSWKPWDTETMGLQLTALPMAVGVGASCFFLGVQAGDWYLERFNEDKNTLGAVLDIGAVSAIFGYTLSQGLLIGALGDRMGGDGGLATPITAGFLNLALWGSALYFSEVNFYRHFDVVLIGFMATTVWSQLAAYHLSASSHDEGAAVRESSSLSTLSFGLAPTAGGVSAGLGFQF